MVHVFIYFIYMVLEEILGHEHEMLAQNEILWKTIGYLLSGSLCYRKMFSFHMEDISYKGL